MKGGREQIKPRTNSAEGDPENRYLLLCSCSSGSTAGGFGEVVTTLAMGDFYGRCISWGR